jgi:branched-chain amino acid aminotransferase
VSEKTPSRDLAFEQGAVSIDGQLTSLADARVPVVDRGFLYGDAVFEALRTFGGVPDALDDHLVRLSRSCAKLGMSLPVTHAQLTAEVEAASLAVPSAERYLRIMITRGDFPEAIAPSADARPRRIILVRPLDGSPLPADPPRIRLTSVVSPPVRLWAGAKPAAYLSNLLAIGAARASGADDALLLGAQGELLEGATSSIFLAHGDRITTPPLSLGILPGITRDRVMRLCGEQGLPITESLAFIDAAYKADEIFLTSSVRGIVSVTQLDSHTIGSGIPGPITKRVRAAYLHFVRGLDHSQSRG